MFFALWDILICYQQFCSFIFIGQGISARLPKFIPDPDDFPVSQFQIPYSRLFWRALELANWSKNVIGEF